MCSLEKKSSTEAVWCWSSGDEAEPSTEEKEKKIFPQKMDIHMADDYVSPLKFLVNGEYSLGKKIGRGSASDDIYIGRSNFSMTVVAVHVESCTSTTITGNNSDKSALKSQSKVIEALEGEEGFPKLQWYGVTGSNHIMVVDLLGHGQSLRDLFVYCDERFTLKTVLMIADQLLARLASLHSKNYVHLNVKPEVCLIGYDSNTENVLHLTSFWLAKQYRDSETYEHIPFLSNKSGIGRGSLPYKSINVMSGIESGRRDDLESLGYMLMEFLRGHLPWQEQYLTAKSVQERREKVLLMKKNDIAELCKGYPNEFYEYFQYVRSLKFDEAPDYAQLRGKFKVLFKRTGFMVSKDNLFDWEIKKKEEDRYKPKHSVEQSVRQKTPPSSSKRISALESEYLHVPNSASLERYPTDLVDFLKEDLTIISQSICVRVLSHLCDDLGASCLDEAMKELSSNNKVLDEVCGFLPAIPARRLKEAVSKMKKDTEETPSSVVVPPRISSPRARAAPPPHRLTKHSASNKPGRSTSSPRAATPPPGPTPRSSSNKPGRITSSPRAAPPPLGPTPRSSSNKPGRNTSSPRVVPHLITADNALMIVDNALRFASHVPVIGDLCGVLRDVVQDAQTLRSKAGDLDALGRRAQELLIILSELHIHLDHLIPSSRDKVIEELEHLHTLVLEMKNMVEKFKQKAYVTKMMTLSKHSVTSENLDKKINQSLSKIENMMRMQEFVTSMENTARLTDEVANMRNMISEMMETSRVYPLQEACFRAALNFEKNDDGLDDENYNAKVCRSILKEGGVSKEFFEEEMGILCHEFRDILRQELREIKQDMSTVKSDVEKISAVFVGTNAMFLGCVCTPTVVIGDGVVSKAYHCVELKRMYQTLDKHKDRLLQDDLFPIVLSDDMRSMSASIAERGALSLVICSRGFGYYSAVNETNVPPNDRNDDLSIDSIIRCILDIPMNKRPHYLFICCRYGSALAATRIQAQVGIPHVFAVPMNLLENEIGYDLLTKQILTSISEVIGTQGTNDYERVKERLQSSLTQHAVRNHQINTVSFKCVESAAKRTMAVKYRDGFNANNGSRRKPVTFESKHSTHDVLNIFESWGIADDIMNIRTLHFDVQFAEKFVRNVLQHTGPKAPHHFYAIRGLSLARCRSVAVSICKDLVKRDGVLNSAIRIEGNEHTEQLNSYTNALEYGRTLFWVDVLESIQLSAVVIDWIKKLQSLSNVHNVVLLITLEYSSLMKLIDCEGELEFFTEVTCTTPTSAQDGGMSRYIENHDMLHQEFNLWVTRTVDTDDVSRKLNIRDVYKSATEKVVNLINKCLPDGCTVLALFDEIDQSTFVRVNIPNIKVLHELRDLILCGVFEAKLTSFLTPGRIQVNVDRSQFVEMYEDSILSMSLLTDHQNEAKNKCSGVQIARIEGRAGTGKTFVALHLLKDILTKNMNSTALLVAKNRALGIFIGKWLCVHLKLKGSSRIRQLLSRLHVLCLPGTNSPRTNLSLYHLGAQNGIIELNEATIDKGTRPVYSVIVIDEAHHIYQREHLLNTVNIFKSKKWLLLSDTSQSVGDNNNYPKSATVAHLTQVVRNSPRIVAGARFFQYKDNANEVSCIHTTSNGPPLLPVLFNNPSRRDNVVKVYVENVIKGVKEVFKLFGDMDLHNRVAIIVPNQEFKKNLKSPLQGAINSVCRNRHIHLVLRDADECSGVIHDVNRAAASNDRSSAIIPESSILYDCIDALDGLERLIVICVGLDKDIGSDKDILTSRSVWYRALTRAHMMVIVVNHHITGGWLEHLTTVKSAAKDVKFDQEKAKQLTKTDAAQGTISTFKNLASSQVAQTVEKMAARKDLIEQDIWDTSLIDGGTEAKTLLFDPMQRPTAEVPTSRRQANLSVDSISSIPSDDFSIPST